MITRDFLAGLNFRVMDETDKIGFSGCESPVSLLAEVGNYLVVIDGNYCEVVSVDGEMIAQCDDIVGLPYTNINTIDIGSGMYDAREGNEDSFSNLGME
jgi:hypothetical protein